MNDTISFTPIFGTAHISRNEDGTPFLCTRVAPDNFWQVTRSLRLNHGNRVFSVEGMLELDRRFAADGEAWIA